jgi:hypothetical protein
VLLDVLWGVEFVDAEGCLAEVAQPAAKSPKNIIRAKMHEIAFLFTI